MKVHGISIMSKPDFSNYLAHFTKDSVCVNEGNVLDDRYCKMSAKDKLISILRERVIYMSTMPWTSSEAVCFTECPWTSFIEHSKSYSPYGVGFSKKFIFGKHGSPAFYLRSDIFLRLKNEKKGNVLLNENVDYLISPFQPSYMPPRIKTKLNKTVDYTHEREWRMNENLKFDYKNIEFVVVKTNEDLLGFPKELRANIGEEKFLVLDSYKLIEKLWPNHKLELK